MTEDEIDALKAMLATEGWRVFTKHVGGEWSSDACLQRIESGNKKHAAGDEPSQQESVRNVLYARDAIGYLMNWPTEQTSKPAVPQPPRNAVERFFGRVPNA